VDAKRRQTYWPSWARASRAEARPVGFPDPRPAEVTPQQRNGSPGLDLAKVIELLGTATVGQMAGPKRGFANRYSSRHAESGLHRVLYPLAARGYDSVAVRSDLELGRYRPENSMWRWAAILQAHFGQHPKFGALLRILCRGLNGCAEDGSKEPGNTVGLCDDPLSMYSKLGKLPMRWWMSTSPCSPG